MIIIINNLIDFALTERRTQAHMIEARAGQRGVLVVSQPYPFHTQVVPQHAR